MTPETGIDRMRRGLACRFGQRPSFFTGGCLARVPRLYVRAVTGFRGWRTGTRWVAVIALLGVIGFSVARTHVHAESGPRAEACAWCVAGTTPATLTAAVVLSNPAVMVAPVVTVPQAPCPTVVVDRLPARGPPFLAIVG
jgi:hypothetical protein